MFLNWEDLKTFLKSVYSEKKDFSFSMLANCKRGSNESIKSYTKRVESYYIKMSSEIDGNLDAEQRAAQESFIKEQILKCFIEGLDRDTRLLVIARDPDSFEEALTIAEPYDLNVQTFNSKSNEVFSYICEKSGHLTKNCSYHPLKNNGRPNTANKSQHYNQTNQFDRGSINNNGSCL